MKPDQQKARTDAIHCLNCQARLANAGSFCSMCGQKKQRLRPTLWMLVSDFFIQQFSLEGRLFQSLKTLVLSPGKLTMEYWAGKRARYFTPVQIYLVTSLVFFLMLDTVSTVTGSAPLKLDETPDIGLQMEKMQRESYHLSVGFRRLTLSRDQFIEFIKTDSAKLESFFGRHEIELSAFSLFFARIAHILLQPDGAKRFILKYFALLTQSVIVLMPLFGLILYGLYWRRSETSVKCIVFSAHLHAFAFLLLIAVSLITTRISFEVPLICAAIGLLAYFFYAQQVVFGGPVWGISIKSVGSLLIYFFCVMGLVILLLPVVYLTL